MPKISAGLLMFRRGPNGLEVLLVHPGGPLWTKRDEGVWTIPKGEVDPGEELLAAAKREFEEETGCKPAGPFIRLAPVRQKSGKIVHAWAFEGDMDTATIKSNTFSMEWPKKSGKWAKFPEIDRGEFFELPVARKKIKQAQAPFLEAIADGLRNIVSR
jgi:predicted NUDIX family NTP pyrophosphohydrolase